MTSSITTHPSPLSVKPTDAMLQKQRAKKVSPQFASGAKVAADTAVDVANLGTAKFFEKFFGGMSNVELRKFNLSLEDWAGRFMTVFGVYIPQAWFSLKEKRRVWENNTRNVLVWFTTLGVYILNKSEKFGLNPVLDEFMRPKEDLGDFVQRRMSSQTDQLKSLVEDFATDVKHMIRREADNVGHNLPATFDEAAFKKREALADKLKTAFVNDFIENKNTAKSVEEGLQEFVVLLQTQATDAEPKAFAKFSKKASGIASKLAEWEATTPETISGLRRKSQTFFNKFRPEKSYFELLQDAHIKFKTSDMKNAHWAKLDDNKVQTLIQKLNAHSQSVDELTNGQFKSVKDLMKAASKEGGLEPETLKKVTQSYLQEGSDAFWGELMDHPAIMEDGVNKPLAEMTEGAFTKFDDLRQAALKNQVGDDVLEKLSEHVPKYFEKLGNTYSKFLNRRNLFSLINVSAISLMTIYIVGNLAMKVILATFAKLDKPVDSDKSKMKTTPRPPQNPLVQTASPAESQAAAAASIQKLLDDLSKMPMPEPQQMPQPQAAQQQSVQQQPAYPSQQPQQQWPPQHPYYQPVNQPGYPPIQQQPQQRVPSYLPQAYWPQPQSAQGMYPQPQRPQFPVAQPFQQPQPRYVQPQGGRR